jgi:hypothetical protein
MVVPPGPEEDGCCDRIPPGCKVCMDVGDVERRVEERGVDRDGGWDDDDDGGTLEAEDGGGGSEEGADWKILVMSAALILLTDGVDDGGFSEGTPFDASNFMCTSYGLVMKSGSTLLVLSSNVGAVRDRRWRALVWWQM